MTLTRRRCLRLALLGAPVFLGRCARSLESLPDPADRRLHARPDGADTASLRLPLPRNAAIAESQPIGFGRDRDGVFYVPLAARRAKGVPFIVFLHGAGGAGSRAMERMIDEADRTGSIVLAPDSRDATWGVASGNADADLAFLDDCLEAAFATYPIDARRIGIAGFSDGASAALSIGLVNGDLFSAISAFSPGFVDLAAPPRGRPRVFISHGSADSILPVERCGRRIARELEETGYTVAYREFDGDHMIPPEIRTAGVDWLVRG